MVHESLIFACPKVDGVLCCVNIDRDSMKWHFTSRAYPSAVPDRRRTFNSGAVPKLLGMENSVWFKPGKLRNLSNQVRRQQKVRNAVHDGILMPAVAAHKLARLDRRLEQQPMQVARQLRRAPPLLLALAFLLARILQLSLSSLPPRIVPRAVHLRFLLPPLCTVVVLPQRLRLRRLLREPRQAQLTAHGAQRAPL